MSSDLPLDHTQHPRQHDSHPVGVLSFAKILWCREINRLYSFLNPCICYNLGHVPLLATLIRSLGSPLSPPWQFAAGEPR
ncbi:MAG: hypothetical protein WB781_23035, partial [Candidatus Sulfotelmatobacter sp.]